MIEIVRATKPMLSWLSSNARERDIAELSCQVSHPNKSLPGIVCHDGSPRDARFAVRYNGKLIAGFGMTHSHIVLPATGNVWAFGTENMWRAIPAISRHMADWLPAYAKANGIRRAEVRALADHDIAHKWVARLGAEKVCDLPQWGKDGELFVLYAWTFDSWENALSDPAKYDWLSRHQKRANVNQSPNGTKDKRP